MKLKNVMYGGGVLVALVLTSCSKTDTNNITTQDQTFMKQASLSNTVEVNAGNLAATKATNPQVKAYAQSMVSEHTMAQTDLRNLGTTVGTAVTDTVDPAHMVIMTQLSGMSGRAFDSAYIYSQVTDHNTTATNFQTEQNSGNRTEVKNYANTYLPHIQMHLTRADSISRAFFKR